MPAVPGRTGAQASKFHADYDAQKQEYRLIFSGFSAGSMELFTGTGDSVAASTTATGTPHNRDFRKRGCISPSRAGRSAPEGPTPP